MVPPPTTHGLTHLSLAVRDPAVSMRFYAATFGFEQYYIDETVRTVKAAGGRILRRGEFAPGYPFAYIADPDGYEVEIWYE